jgi:hypothetical protein
MPALIRIKTADLLYQSEILDEAKVLCTKVTFEKDEVAFEPQGGQLVPLVTLLSHANVPFSTSFSNEEKVEMKIVS